MTTPRSSGWTVYSYWRPINDWAAGEMAHTYPDWPTARWQALHTICLSGVRTVTVVDPDHIVVGDYDNFIRCWRQYALPVGSCPRCPGQLHARPGDTEVTCPQCKAKTSASAPGLRTPFDHQR